jgi:hypothetical protein
MSKCQKISYLTKDYALQDLKAAKKKGYAVRRVYQCDKCSWWHVTSWKNSNFIKEEINE